MGHDEIMKFAAENCRYKKFKWHTEEMCDHCREDAIQINEICTKIVDKTFKDAIGVVEGAIGDHIRSVKSGAGFFEFLTGQARNTTDTLIKVKDSILCRIKMIKEK
jgi:aminopeptidase-like protein